MSEPVVVNLFVTVRAEVRDQERALNRTCDRVRSALSESRTSGDVTPSPTSIVVSVDPPRERRVRKPRWANNMNDRDEDE